jgi:polyisoprenoid-binding protein YceI
MNVGASDEQLVETEALTPRYWKTRARLHGWFPTLAPPPQRRGPVAGDPGKSREDGARNFCGWSRIGWALAIAAITVFAAGAWGQHFTVDPGSSEVHFTLGASDGPVNGSFRVTGGEFTLDQASGAMTGTVTVDAATGTSGNQKRDKKMANDQMKAQTYPAITFAPSKFSGAVKDSADSTGQVDGNFTLLGQGHPISVPMSVHMESDKFSATGEFTVPFVSWGMKDPSFMMFKVEKQVKVQLKLAGTVSK